MKIFKNKYSSHALTIAKQNKTAVLLFIVLCVIGDIFFISGSSDIRTFGFLGLTIVSILIYKLASKLLFQFCLILLIIMFWEFIFTGTSEVTEKAAVWFFLFFATGIIRQWKE